jgi:hypothetical protein
MTGTRRLITLESKAQAQKKNEEGILRLRLQMSDPNPGGSGPLSRPQGEKGLSQPIILLLAAMIGEGAWQMRKNCWVRRGEGVWLAWINYHPIASSIGLKQHDSRLDVLLDRNACSRVSNRPCMRFRLLLP